MLYWYDKDTIMKVPLVKSCTYTGHSKYLYIDLTQLSDPGDHWQF